LGNSPTVIPKLSKEWHPTKNGDITPEMVVAGSGRKAWWLCDTCTHEWHAVVRMRNQGCGCPKCDAERQTSFPEQAIFFYLSKHLPCENRFVAEGKELDVYIPSLGIGIEYDGLRYHDNSLPGFSDKQLFFEEKGITVYHVKESDVEAIDEANRVIYCIPSNSYKYLSRVIHILGLWIIGKTIPVDLSKDTSAIHNQYIKSRKENSVAEKVPESMRYWDYEKNGNLKPENVTRGSTKKVWWMCEYGHSWQGAVHSFANSKHRCPYCAGRKAWPGYNDLKTTHPHLIYQQPTTA